MKKWIAILLTLTCGLSFGSCKNQKSEAPMGEIVETKQEGESSWNYAHQTDLDRLNAIFDEKKAETEAFYQVPQAKGTTYYISSENGSDTANGTSSNTAWKTCYMLSSVSLKEGDAVLFECGSVFREQIKLVNGVTYASYGTGDKPVFYGSIDASKKSDWKAVSDVSNLYRYVNAIPSSNDIGSIVFDGGEAWGIKIQKLEDSNKSMALYDVSNGLESFEKIQSFPLDAAKDLARYGKTNLTFYHDSSNLYLYCEGGNPAEVFSSVELSQHVRIFHGDHVKNVTVANINFKNATFGIRTAVCENLVVRNCGFEFIGGQIQFDYVNSSRNYKTRLGNGIENWDACDGMTVENCYFNQIYDTAVTTQSNTKGTDMSNVTYRNNVMENLVMGVELWSVAGEDAVSNFTNIKIEGNVCRNIGYGMTSQRPDKVGYFLRASDGPYTIYENAEMTDNVIMGSKKFLLEVNYTRTNENANGFLMDRNIYVNALGKQLGKFSSAFPKHANSTTEYAYDYETVKTFQDAGVEKNGTFYFTVEKTADGSQQEMKAAFEASVYESSTYVYQMDGGKTLPFRLIFPDGYEEGKSYKLFVYLNSEYTAGTDNLKNVQMQSELMEQVYADGGYILLVPQCPDETWIGANVTQGNYSVDRIQESDVMKSVYGLIHDVALKYQTAGTYAAGISAGAYGVADLCARHEDLLKAAVILAGAGDPNASIGNTKVLIYHGEGDEKIPVENAKSLAQAWDAEYREQSRELHDCWKVVYAKEDIVGWLNQQ